MHYCYVNRYLLKRATAQIQRLNTETHELEVRSCRRSVLIPGPITHFPLLFNWQSQSSRVFYGPGFGDSSKAGR